MHPTLKQIKDIRCQRKWTIRQLAADIGISESTLRRGLRGIGNMSEINLYLCERWESENYELSINAG